jgi:ABC-type multidrug transport system fused ATPase/permease subunit
VFLDAAHDMEDALKPQSWIKHLRLMHELTAEERRFSFFWLTGARIAVGFCDLVLAAAMYELFLLLQGSLPAHHFWWIPKTTLTAAVVTSALVVLRAGLDICSTRAVVRCVQNVYTTILIRLTRGYTEMRWGRFVERNRSELLNHVVYTSRETATFYHLAIELTSSVTVVAAMAGAIVYQSPSVFCALAVAALLFYAMHRFFIRKRLQIAGEGRERSLRVLQRTLADMFSSGKEIRTYANQDFFYKRIGEQAASVEKENLSLVFLPQIARILSDQGVVLMFLVIVIAVELRNGDVRQLLSLLVFYFVLSRRMLPLINQVSFIASQMEGSYECVRAVRRELDECSEHRAPILSVILPGSGVVLEIEDVSFAFDKDAPILSEIDLRLRAGESVIVRGISGSGKSTLLNLIAGVSSPTAGVVRIDRTNVAYVPQEVALLDDSIRNNLLFGLTGISEADMRSALAVANLDEFVLTQPLGLETRVGDNGIMLSGGERQRLGLARAILRGVTLLLLDEATSALDEYGEAKVLENLRKTGVAVLLVTHRVQRQIFSHRILHLRRGRLEGDVHGIRDVLQELEQVQA